MEREVRLNEFGKIVKETWEWLPKQYPYVELGAFSVMPDHFHGILQIVEIEDTRKGGSRPALPGYGSVKVKPLDQLIGVLKTVLAKKINLLRSTPGARVWHRNYYDPIIRDDAELRKIWDYIVANPRQSDKSRMWI